MGHSSIFGGPLGGPIRPNHKKKKPKKMFAADGLPSAGESPNLSDRRDRGTPAAVYRTFHGRCGQLRDNGGRLATGETEGLASGFVGSWRDLTAGGKKNGLRKKKNRKGGNISK